MEEDTRRRIAAMIAAAAAAAFIANASATPAEARQRGKSKDGCKGKDRAKRRGNGAHRHGRHA